jgi:hypothetical protein
MAQLGRPAGIHWHANPANEIEYVATDAKRQEIPYVRLKDEGGHVREYRTTGATDATVAGGQRRRMDCVDCHNRPTHAFFATPERAVDAAIARGLISPRLPFARRQAVEVLKATYQDASTANQEIAQRLRSFYAENDPPSAPAPDAELDQLVRTAQFLYARDVFPAMNVSWGTYHDNLGHTDSPGCFRCHDDQHKSAEGQTIRQDCSLCHEIQ